MEGLTPEQQSLYDKLTHLQRMVVLNHVRGGMSQREAYYAAGGKAKSHASADSSVNAILSRVEVKAFYDSLMSGIAKSAVMTREEALETLSKMARTSVKDVANFRKVQVGTDDDGDPVYQSVWELKDDSEIDDDPAMAISELSSGKDGMKFKLHSRAAAIKQLADLEGWNAPSKHEHTGKDGEAIEVKDVSANDLARRIALLLSGGVKKDA